MARFPAQNHRNPRNPGHPGGKEDDSWHGHPLSTNAERPEAQPTARNPRQEEGWVKEWVGESRGEEEGDRERKEQGCLKLVSAHCRC
eukprot:1518602-Pyramimonas_sp.AAC.1